MLTMDYLVSDWTARSEQLGWEINSLRTTHAIYTVVDNTGKAKKQWLEMLLQWQSEVDELILEFQPKAAA
jgi:hypothetical protein